MRVASRTDKPLNGSKDSPLPKLSLPPALGVTPKAGFSSRLNLLIPSQGTTRKKLPAPMTSATTSLSKNNRVRFPRRRQTVLFSVILFTFVLTILFMAVAGIDCFKCVSLNGDNPSCEDPFHNNYSSSILEAPCMGGRKGRNGLFPATACIKLTGTYYDTKTTVVVRGCALDSGTLTADTEIIRMSHCGHFELDERYVKGCLQSCDDADGCNAADGPNYSSLPLLILIPTLLVLHVFQSHFSLSCT